jgi:hypothetical protein
MDFGFAVLCFEGKMIAGSWKIPEDGHVKKG